MAAEFEEKLAEAVRKYTCLYNKLSGVPTSKINPRESSCTVKMNFANPYISLSVGVGIVCTFLAFLFHAQNENTLAQ